MQSIASESLRPIAAVLACVASLCFSRAAMAQRSWYVAPPASGGNDSNPGTQPAPFATLQRAADLAQPGDTVITLPGTYVGFNAVRSGTTSQPITFRGTRSASGEWLTIIATEAARYNGNSHHARINLDSVSHIHVADFEIIGGNDQRTSKSGVRAVTSPGNPNNGIRVGHCHIHHNGKWGVFSGHVSDILVEHNWIHNTHNEHGVYLSNSGDRHIIRYNRIHSNSSNGVHLNGDLSQGGDGVMSDLTVQWNTIYDNGAGGPYIDEAGIARTSAGGGSAVNCDGVQNSSIQRNLMYDNHASGISLYRIDGGAGSTGNVVANNTIHNAANGRWCLNIANGSTGNTVFNNIFINNHSFRGGLIVTADSIPGLLSDYNIVMDRFDPGTGSILSLAQWRAATGQDTHSINRSPAQYAALFANLAAADYHLEIKSVARNAGISAFNGEQALFPDLAGNLAATETLVDIGAYEAVRCSADFDCDGDTGTDADIEAFFACLGGSCPPVPCASSADIDGDGDTGTDADIERFFVILGGGCST